MPRTEYTPETVERRELQAIHDKIAPQVFYLVPGHQLQGLIRTALYHFHEENG
jgi:hypothetical protein